MLQIDEIDVYYGAIHALKRLSLDVEEGSIVTLIGANGAGKTTTLKTISGLLRPKTGRILFNNNDITKIPPEKIVGLGISQVPEGRRVFPSLSVLENLEMGAYLRKDKKAIAADMENVFSRFPRLRERSKQLAGTLSGGEQQMLAIGRALMTNPQLLILDEATEGLSPLVRQEIWSALRQIKAQGMAILIVDKNLGPLLSLADHHHVVEKGQVVWSGTSEALRADRLALQRYLSVGGGH